MQDLIRKLLSELGEDPDREGLVDTPKRVETSLKFLTSGYEADVDKVLNNALFTVDYSEMVIVKDIDFFSMCEHHLLPFFGKCHVAYIPNTKVIGLSKIPRLVDVFSRRLQVQERLTNQIAQTIEEKIQPMGVAVVMEATHLCVAMRGVEKQRSLRHHQRDAGRVPEQLADPDGVPRADQPAPRDDGRHPAGHELPPRRGVKGMRRAMVVLAAALLASAPAFTQTTSSAAKKPATKPATKKPAAKPAAKPVEPSRIAASAKVTCPQVLGNGINSKLQFCDVVTGRNPADGVRVQLPPHKGLLTLTLDLHNRHTYSEETVKAGKGYANYTATIGALTMDGTLLARGVVRSEFRTAKDLLDRIGGGAGPSRMKAIAPVGAERISIDVPEDVVEVSLLGEKLTVLSVNGTETFTAAQRPIAVVSNINIDYQPIPVKPPAKKTPAKKSTTTKKK